MDNKFLNLCRDNEGKLDELREMYRTYNINIHINYDNAFRWSCYNGHLNIAEWLYSLGGVDIHANRDEAFIWSCHRNNIEMIKWLFSIDKFDNVIVDDNLPKQLYEYAFSMGYLPICRMIPAYAEYKNKIKDKIKEKHENGNIGVFELSYLVDIIMIYV